MDSSAAPFPLASLVPAGGSLVSSGSSLSDDDALRLAEATTAEIPELMAAARAVRDRAWGRRVTFSPKVFLPLTNLCKNRCSYCSFRRSPSQAGAWTMTPPEVDETLSRARDAGCAEALFCLGDKPEGVFPSYRAELASWGHAGTVDYLVAAGEVALRHGLLPHTNAGLLTAEDMVRLKRVNVSLGLMLECVSPRLCLPGMPHANAPDKRPELRLRMIREAGELAIPFTTGILIGIGETRRERIESLLAIRDLHRAHGHIQEVIVQNFRANEGSPMRAASEPDQDEIAHAVAMSRLILDEDVSVQAPPNLNAATTARLLAAGVNDLGGISPVTPDYINPGHPWPHLAGLADLCAREGYELLPRLAIYDRFVDRPGFLDRALAEATTGVGERLARVRRPSDLAREPRGAAQQVPVIEDVERTGDTMNVSGDRPRSPALETSLASVELGTRTILERCLAGVELGWEDAVLLCQVDGPALDALCEIADAMRAAQAGDVVTYVVNRNINFTNACVKACRFCAFARGHRSEEAYFLGEDEVVRRAVEARDLGATEVCVQAGLAPGIDGRLYVQLCRAIKAAAPELHVHAFSPEEVKYGAGLAGVPIRAYLEELKDAGLGSLPGTSAEVLDDAVRARIAPTRITTAEWIDVVRTAHSVGLPTTSTIMYGHIETDTQRMRHLDLLRSIQKETGGFTEFVPLSFVHTESPMFQKGMLPGVRPGPEEKEVFRLFALARLMLGATFRNIQVSWVKEGEERAERLLACGGNDLGGTLMNESISTSAGSAHGQVMTPSALRRMIRAAGRTPAERNTRYELLRTFPAALAGAGDGSEEPREALDALENAEAKLGSYAALTRDGRFRFQLKRAPRSA